MTGWLPLFILLANFPQEPTAWLHWADQAYRRGHTARALALYDALLQCQPPTAGNFYQNLGHLHAQRGEWPQAILAYQTARQRSTRCQAELASSLLWARFQVDPEARDSINMYRIALTLAWLQEQAWFRISIASWGILLAIGTVLSQRGRAVVFRWTLVLAIPYVLLSVGMVWLHGFIDPWPSSLVQQQVAVVRVEGALLRQGNGFSYPAWQKGGQPLRLYAGQEVRIVAVKSNDWLLIQLVDGQRGWLPPAALWTLPHVPR